VPCPWFSETVEYCREHPKADLGVHLTLNCEYPRYRWRALTGRDSAPGLYDEQGYMWLTTAEAQAHVSPEEGEREMRAQVEAALAAGIDVTHLDTHMGSVLHPKFLATYVSLGIEYRLPLFLVRPDRALLESRGLLSLWELMEPRCGGSEARGRPCWTGSLETPDVEETKGTPSAALRRAEARCHSLSSTRPAAPTDGGHRRRRVARRDAELFHGACGIRVGPRVRLTDTAR
jgi:hypothetical protein